MRRFRGRWGRFVWAGVAAAVALVSGALVVLSRPFGGRTQSAFEHRVETYLETRSRYRHTLDHRGEVKSVRCARHEDHSAFRGSDYHACNIRFAKIGSEPWRAGTQDGVFFLSPCSAGSRALPSGKLDPPCDAPK